MAITIKTVILKDGMPSVEQARARLSTEIHVAQQSGIKVLKSRSRLRFNRRRR